MYLAWKNIIPPKEYNHDPNITDNDIHTVCYYLYSDHLPIPNEWYDNIYKHHE